MGRGGFLIVLFVLVDWSGFGLYYAVLCCTVWELYRKNWQEPSSASYVQIRFLP